MVEWESAGLKEGVPAHPIAAGKISLRRYYVFAACVPLSMRKFYVSPHQPDQFFKDFGCSFKEEKRLYCYC